MGQARARIAYQWFHNSGLGRPAHAAHLFTGFEVMMDDKVLLALFVFVFIAIAAAADAFFATGYLFVPVSGFFGWGAFVLWKKMKAKPKTYS